MLTPPNYLRRDPSNVTDDTEARHTARTAADLRHEEAVLPTRILVARFGYVVCIDMCGMI